MPRFILLAVLCLAVLGTTTSSAATRPVYWSVPQATHALSQVGLMHAVWVANLDDTRVGRYQYLNNNLHSQTCRGVGVHRGTRYRAFACVVTLTDHWPVNRTPFKAWVVPRGALWTPGLNGGGFCATAVALSVCTKPRMPNDPRICTRDRRPIPLVEVDSCVLGRAATAFNLAYHRQQDDCFPTGFLRFRCAIGEAKYRVVWASRTWSITPVN